MGRLCHRRGAFMQSEDLEGGAVWPRNPAFGQKYIFPCGNSSCNSGPLLLRSESKVQHQEFMLTPIYKHFTLKSHSTYAVMAGFFFYSIGGICAAAFTKHGLSICNLLRYNLKNAYLPFMWKGSQSIAVDYPSMCMVQEYSTFVIEKQMGFSICIFVDQRVL